MTDIFLALNVLEGTNEKLGDICHQHVLNRPQILFENLPLVWYLFKFRQLADWRWTGYP